MKPVFISTQKTMMFIPVVNVFVLYVWLYNAIVKRETIGTILKSFFRCIAFAFPCWLFLSIFSRGSYGLEHFGSLVIMYCVPLVCSYVLIRYQESLGYS